MYGEPFQWPENEDILCFVDRASWYDPTAAHRNRPLFPMYMLAPGHGLLNKHQDPATTTGHGLLNKHQHPANISNLYASTRPLQPAKVY